MNIEKLDRLIDTMPERGIPACDLIVTREAEPIYRRMCGFSDYERTRPVSESDLYWCFSTSKISTCVAAMQLVERGIISPSDRLDRYLPAFSHMKVRGRDGSLTDAQTPILLEHIFTMTAGMNYDWSPAERYAAAHPEAGTAEIISALAETPLLFEPGTHYKYSLCHDVLGAVVEVASGMPFGEYLQKNIFEPCGMSDTGFAPTAEQQARFSAVYGFVYHNGTCVPRDPASIHQKLPFGFPSGGQGLFTRTDEYVKLMSALACAGTPRGCGLLRPETLDMIEQNRLCPDARTDFCATRLFGYGWGYCGRVHVDPVYSLSRSPAGEFGWDGAAGAYALVDRKNRLAIYFSAHIMSCGYIYRKIHPMIRDLVYED